MTDEVEDVVIPFTGITRLDTPPERVLEHANTVPFEGVIVLGWRSDTEEMFFASSYASGPEVLWLLEMAKRDLLDAGAGE